jgi:hypothetical protein
MSQAGIISVAGGGGGGAPVQTLTGNSGGVVSPTANNIFILGGTSTVNNSNGITVIDTPGTSTLTVTLTNQISGDTSTSTAVPKTLITFPLGAVPGVYTFSGDITAFDVTDTAGASYGVISGIRTTGASAIELGTQFNTNFEEAAMITADIDVTVSGNNVIFQVTGVALKTIDWDGFFTYRFVG